MAKDQESQLHNTSVHMQEMKRQEIKAIESSIKTKYEKRELEKDTIIKKLESEI